AAEEHIELTTTWARADLTGAGQELIRGLAHGADDDDDGDAALACLDHPLGDQLDLLSIRDGRATVLLNHDSHNILQEKRCPSVRGTPPYASRRRRSALRRGLRCAGRCRTVPSQVQFRARTAPRSWRRSLAAQRPAPRARQTPGARRTPARPRGHPCQPG